MFYKNSLFKIIKVIYKNTVLSNWRHIIWSRNLICCFLLLWLFVSSQRKHVSPDQWKKGFTRLFKLGPFFCQLRPHFEGWTLGCMSGASQSRKTPNNSQKSKLYSLCTRLLLHLNAKRRPQEITPSMGLFQQQHCWSCWKISFFLLCPSLNQWAVVFEDAKQNRTLKCQVRNN